MDQWGVEGLLAAVERGDINDWRRIARALQDDPHGKIAHELADVAAIAENPAIPSLLQRIHHQALGSSPAFQANVARCRSRDPSRVSADVRPEKESRP